MENKCYKFDCIFNFDSKCESPARGTYRFKCNCMDEYSEETEEIKEFKKKVKLNIQEGVLWEK